MFIEQIAVVTHQELLINIYDLQRDRFYNLARTHFMRLSSETVHKLSSKPSPSFLSQTSLLRRYHVSISNIFSFSDNDDAGYKKFEKKNTRFFINVFYKRLYK